jgi:hypothetical protein
LTHDPAAAAAPEPDSEASPIVLRASTALQAVPPERPPAPPKAAAVPAVAPAGPPPAAAITLASLTRFDTALPAAVTLPRRLVAAPPPELTWALASFALAAGVGWVYERRQRRKLEVDGDSALWPSVPGQGARRASSGGAVDETFPDGRDIVAASHPVYVSVIGDTPSRREATLVDLHELRERLEKLAAKRNLKAAAELLEEHLVDFRYSSPWVFLELRELYQQLARPEEWELVRDAFRTRFGQNAPQWNAPSTAGEEIANDKQLCDDLLRKWPHREARLFILRWLLGDAQSRQKSVGPPQLALGVYRDMLLLDSILDDAMTARPAADPVPA